jgi:hypothetical protein
MRQSGKQSEIGALAGVVPMVLVSVLFAGCGSFTPQPAVPISEITNAAESGQTSAQIISSMNQSKTTYALRGSDFAKLSARRVPGPVLDELQQRFFSEVEFLTRRWYHKRKAGGPTSIYPQPLDLDNLEQGGNGMAPTTDVGKFTAATRPPGVPVWVPANPASRNAIWTDDLMEMTRSGQTTQQIVEQVQNSQVRNIYTTSATQSSRTRTAAMIGSMYASLAKQGVAAEVLDAFQGIYFASHVEQSRIRFRGSMN